MGQEIGKKKQNERGFMMTFKKDDAVKITTGKYVVVNETVGKIVDFGRIVKNKHTAKKRIEQLTQRIRNDDVHAPLGKQSKYCIYKLKEVV